MSANGEAFELRSAILFFCNSTWGELMYRIKDYLEGRNPGPHWRE
jgi:hypothetical protein